MARTEAKVEDLIDAEIREAKKGIRELIKYSKYLETMKKKVKEEQK